MSSFHLTRTRTRERTPEYDTYYSRPLVRRDSKRQRVISLSSSDDGHDDYPYSGSHKPPKTSRALTVRNQPSQLERYNIWSDNREYHASDDEDDRRKSYDRRRSYKYTSNRHHYSDDDVARDPEERDFRFKVEASIARPRSSHAYRHHDDLLGAWPIDTIRRKEKWVDEGWETRERSLSRERTRRDSFWGGDDENDSNEQSESWSRFRRIKRTKTEEFRPLSGWRRNRIVYGS